MKDKYYIKIDLDEAQYRHLKERAEAAGYSNVVDYVRSLALSEDPCAKKPPDISTLSREVSKRLERMLADILNPYTGKIDEINRKLSDIIESLELVVHRREEEAPPRQAQVAREREQRPARRGASTAAERLRSEGVVFYSDVKWMRAPERLFQKLEKEGALILGSGDDMIAVDPNFWEEFKAEVEELGIRDSEEAATIIRERLGERAGRLFQALVKRGAIIYDEDLNKWIVVYP